MFGIKSAVASISSIFLAIGFLAVGYGMIMTFVGIHLKELGIQNSIIGIINSAFFLGAIGSSIFSQKIISNVGHIRSFAAFASVMVASFLLHSLYFDEVLWTLLRFFAGFSYYGLLIILESWLNEKSTSETRGKVIAIYTIVFYLAIALGQLVLTQESSLSQSIFVFGSILVLVSIVLITLTRIKEPVIKPFEKYSLPKIFAVVPLATVTSFIGGFLFGGFFAIIPVYLLAQFHSVSLVSYFMLFCILGGLLSQWPIGILSDKYGRRKLIAYCALFLAFVSSLFVFLSPSPLLLYGFGFLLGTTLFSLYPLAVARANDIVDENKDIVEISRTLLFTYGIGSFVSPIVLGFLMEYYNKALFVAFCVIGIFLTLYALSKKRVADDDLSQFVNMPIAPGAEFPELDPRSEE